MIYPQDVYNQLNRFLNFKVSFSSEYQTYLFRDIWSYSYDKEYFENEYKKTYSIILQQLAVGRNNNDFLKELLSYTEQKLEDLVDFFIDDLSFFERGKILKANILPNNFDESYKSIPNYGSFNESLDENQNDFIDFLYTFSFKTNNYSTPLDYEKVKLLYCTTLYKNNLEELNAQLWDWKHSVNFIDFSNALRETDSPNTNINNKCGSNLKKNNLASLFYILMSEGLLFFDKTNFDNNRSQMQRFIEDNFTYKGDGGQQVKMTRISRHFSEAKGFTYKEKQIDFINDLISILEKRRDSLQ